jgi:hypothetical protein
MKTPTNYWTATLVASCCFAMIVAQFAALARLGNAVELMGNEIKLMRQQSDIHYAEVNARIKAIESWIDAQTQVIARTKE